MAAANMPRYYCDYCDTFLTHESVRPRCGKLGFFLSLLRCALARSDSGVAIHILVTHLWLLCIAGGGEKAA